MSIASLPKNQCCGCTACMSVCPKDAIVMAADGQGFLYPKIDPSKCIECGLCDWVCSEAGEQKKAPLSAYAVKNRDEAVRKRSSSGGAAHGLCRSMIEQGGVVYGVAYDKNHRVVTERAATLAECEAFYGSKYVQTDVGATFRQVYADLKAGTGVLYFGTSCHIAGLLSYLNRKKANTERLVTVDLICHGVPSPKLFADYIDFLAEDHRFAHFEFRTKALPWGYGSKNYGCTVYLRSGKKQVDSLKARLFLNLFFSNTCLRPYCYGCKYASLEKPADITIADYWGLQEAHPEFFDEGGVSAVVINSQKGEQFLRSAGELVCLKSTVENITRKQGNIGSPSPKSKDYDTFWKLYEEKGFPAVAKKYGGYHWKRAVKTGLRKLGLLK